MYTQDGLNFFPQPAHSESRIKMELRDTRAVVLFVLLKVVLWAKRQKRQQSGTVCFPR